MRTALLRLTACAMMIALAIILCRLLGFPQTGAYRVEISFLPIAVVAMMFGPVWAGASYGIADLLGAAVTTGINPFITLCKVAFGAAMGFAFYKKKPGIIRTVVFYIVAGLVIDIGMMSLIFIYGFGYSVKAALGYRLIGFAVNTPIFTRAVLHLPKGDLTITGGSEKDIYIKDMQLNGKPYASTWIEWDDVSEGGTIEYKVSAKPTTWGQSVLPPSYE